MLFSWNVISFAQNSCLFGQGEEAAGELVEGSLHRPGAGHHHNVPAGLEPELIEPVDFPQPPSGAVAAGVKHHLGICVAAGMVQPAENMIEL